jgi:TatD DNase family protein
VHNLIDAHAHLNDVAAIDSALERARAVGVTKIVAVGMDIRSNRRILRIAAAHPEMVLPAVGFHPWSMATEPIDATLAFVKAHLGSCAALGEVGLDYKVKVKKAVQWEVFKNVLGLAADLAKPVIVHARFSHQRCHQMVAEAAIEKAVFHWYSGPLDLLEKIIADGYYVSCTPALGYSTAHRSAIRQAPLDRILVETDCPAAYKARASEPADLLDTVGHLSCLKGLAAEETARITTANARAFFGLQ